MSNTNQASPDSEAKPFLDTPSLESRQSESNELYSKWSSFFSYKLGQLSTKEEEQYVKEKEAATYRKDWVRCNKWSEQLMSNSPMIVFMLKELRKAGCAFEKPHFKCAPCDGSRSSGFKPDAAYGNGPILLCQNGFFSKKHLEDTMAHELMHAFDHCRYKVDWDNLYHYACSVVRATSLSGDCGFFNEFKRGNFSIGKQHQHCVRRRAILAVQYHPRCPDKDTATKVVNAVFTSCFNDTSPFDEIY